MYFDNIYKIDITDIVSTFSTVLITYVAAKLTASTLYINYFSQENARFTKCYNRFRKMKCLKWKKKFSWVCLYKIFNFTKYLKRYYQAINIT